MQVETVNKSTFEAKVFSKGTLKLPVSLRNELHIHDGDKILFIKKDDSWIITTHLNNIKSTQKYLSQLSKNNDSAVEELINSRRREAKEF